MKRDAITNKEGGLVDRETKQILKFYNTAPTTSGTERIAPDGGYAVPADFRADIWDKLTGEFSLLGLTNQLYTTSNVIVWTKNEVEAWNNADGSGVRVYWKGEGSALTQSKPLLESSTETLGKLSALIPISEELSEDAPSIDSYLRRTTANKFDSELNRCFVDGSGVGQPLGILNSGCLVSVAKESAQAADTIVYANLAKMVSRCYGPSFARSVWLINPDCWPQLFQLHVSGNNNDTPVFQPPQGAAGAPMGTLFGRPIIPVQACKTVGDKGDIVLADFSQYMTVMKASGMRTDVSMHLYFDTDHLAYRFVLRISGMPLWRTYITPLNGNNYQSCFISLDERAG